MVSSFRWRSWSDHPAIGIHWQRTLSHSLRHGLQLVLGQGEDHGYGLKLCDHEQWIRVRGMHHISRIDQPQADASAFRCGNVTVAKVEFALSTSA
jgi:hypothetical protein